MRISRDTVVQFNYRLQDAAGKLLESSDGAGPTTYLHGHGAMLPDLERALEGLEPGNEITLTLKEPYGPTYPDRVQRVPLKHLHAKKKPVPGAVVVVNGRDGARQVTIVKVGKFSVDVDTNHPFAGMTLTFDIVVTAVREASAEEIAHGHVHGPEGDQH